MADSIPSLREKVAELQQRIAELESRGPVEVERIVYVDREVEIEVPGPERVVEKIVEVEVPVAYYPPSYYRVVEDVPVYIDNPEYERTIRTLQDKLCQFTSQ